MDKTVRHARKLRTIRAPVFPRYLFVVLDLQRDRWRSVNGTFGVAGLIMANQLPQPVPGGVVETLHEWLDESGRLRLDRDLKVGQRIRVSAGPFAAALGTLTRLDDHGRVSVLLEIMGGQVAAQLDASAMAPVH
jgi:transcriptional antiterminator RfaH